jgi:23S rRNA pseudouridine2604 synthase
VKKLRRVKMGPLRLKGLAVGEWRDLTAEELDQVRRDAFADAATIHRRRERAERNEGGAPVRKRRGIHASRRNEKSDRLERRAQRTRELSAKARAERGSARAGAERGPGSSRAASRPRDGAPRAAARGEARPNAKPAPRGMRDGARGVMGARDGDRKGAKGSRSGGDRRGGASARGAAPKGKPGRNRRDDASLDHRRRLS